MTPSLIQTEITPVNVRELLDDAQKQLVRYKKAGKDQKKKLGGNGKHCDAAWE
jgi:hypothetical protein